MLNPMKTFLITIFTLVSLITSGQSTTTKLNLWATYYYVPSFEHDENGIDLLDKNGKALGFKLNSCDWCTAAIEGSVFIRKNNIYYVLNYAGRSATLQNDCRACPKYQNYSGYEKTGKVVWTLSSGFGKGVRNYNLVPFRTIAVDTSIIPIGTVIYIPQAKGVKFTTTDGSVQEHDGYFFAGDVGSKITGNHIDVYIGASLQNPFSFITSNQSSTFEAFIVSDKEICDRILKEHQ